MKKTYVKRFQKLTDLLMDTELAKCARRTESNTFSRKRKMPLKDILLSCLAKKLLPEYEAVIFMYGVGEITTSQLTAVIGDVRRLENRGSLIGFAGIDPEVSQSGKHESKSMPTTKRGSPHLRKMLYQVVSTYETLTLQRTVLSISRSETRKRQTVLRLHDRRR